MSAQIGFQVPSMHWRYTGFLSHVGSQSSKLKFFADLVAVRTIVRPDNAHFLRKKLCRLRQVQVGERQYLKLLLHSVNMMLKYYNMNYSVVSEITFSSTYRSVSNIREA